LENAGNLSFQNGKGEIKHTLSAYHDNVHSGLNFILVTPVDFPDTPFTSITHRSPSDLFRGDDAKPTHPTRTGHPENRKIRTDTPILTAVHNI
tara:strand:+ start:4051 stop:4329 length:279 start_codon:yes stop_codon:yes gene_type:complete